MGRDKIGWINATRSLVFGTPDFYKALRKTTEKKIEQHQQIVGIIGNKGIGSIRNNVIDINTNQPGKFGIIDCELNGDIADNIIVVKP